MPLEDKLAVLLEVDGWHVPSDIAGGVVLAAFVLALLARGRGARLAPPQRQRGRKQNQLIEVKP